MSRRVVVTGMGCITAIGNTAEDFWKNAVAGVSGASFNPLFESEKNKIPVNFSCQVKDFENVQSLYMQPKQIRRTDYFLRYAIAAAAQAVEQSGLEADESTAERIGTLIGTGIGGVNWITDWAIRCHEKQDYSRVTPFFVPGVISNLASGEVSIRYGFKGPSFALSSACASGTHCIGESMRMIRDGRADAMVCGGTEFVSLPMVVAGFAAARALSTRNDAPEKASRPFDKGRDGFVLGEGAAILVLEEYESARRRGATIYAECLGYGTNADAYHITAPSGDGKGASSCIEMTLKDAQLNPQDVDYINAHGTSTPKGDLIEVTAIRRVMGDYADKVLVNSTKSMTGHLLGASGALEALVCVQSLNTKTVHPTINVEEQDPECTIDCVANVAREAEIKVALSNSFGFGGTNASLILGHPDRL